MTPTLCRHCAVTVVFGQEEDEWEAIAAARLCSCNGPSSSPLSGGGGVHTQLVGWHSHRRVQCDGRAASASAVAAPPTLLSGGGQTQLVGWHRLLTQCGGSIEVAAGADGGG